jgi:polar amino acid transport system substrate-binding protein
MVLQQGGVASAKESDVPAHVRALASQSSKIQEVLSRGHLIVGTGADNPPWHFNDAKGNLVGMDISMAYILANGMFSTDPTIPTGKVQFVTQAADARIPNLLANKVDICIQFMTVTGGRSLQVEFTIPYYVEASNMLFKANSPYTSSQSLIGKHVTIAALQNVDVAYTVHSQVPDANILAVPSAAEVVLAVDTGRAQAGLVDLSTSHYLSKLYPNKYRASTTPFNPQNYAAAVQQGDQVWINYVNQVFHDAITGQRWQLYAAAFEQWFGVKLSAPKAGFPAEYGDRGV